MKWNCTDTNDGKYICVFFLDGLWDCEMTCLPIDGSHQKIWKIWMIILPGVDTDNREASQFITNNNYSESNLIDLDACTCFRNDISSARFNWSIYIRFCVQCSFIEYWPFPVNVLRNIVAKMFNIIQSMDLVRSKRKRKNEKD